MRDCTGLHIGIASLSSSSRPLSRKAGPDVADHKGRRPNGDPRAGAAGIEGRAGTAGTKARAGTAGTEGTVGTADTENTAVAEGTVGKVDRSECTKRMAFIHIHFYTGEKGLDCSTYLCEDKAPFATWHSWANAPAVGECAQLSPLRRYNPPCLLWPNRGEGRQPC